MTEKETMPMNDCEPSTANLLSVDEALVRIRDALPTLQGFETLHLRDALGRTLHEDILSPINVPGYDNSAMDGYAFRHTDQSETDTTTLQVVGSSFAGKPFSGNVGKGEAVRIMTGAVIPDGCDTVVMQEMTERADDRVTISATLAAGANVRYAGEDLQEGKPVLNRGQRLNPAELGLLASLGIPEVRVSRRLRVAIFSTGDELRSLGQPLGEGQIYDSNRYSLYGMLQRLGADILDMGVIADQREAVRQAFEHASHTADVVITSGGVSVGEADYVKETLDALGQVGFWKIAMKPGKPLAFGQINGTTFFGLPGNPVSAMATFYQIVQPSLRHLQGQQETQPLRLQARCIETLKKRPGRRDFQRGLLESDADGQLTVRGIGNQGSHVLSSMSRANCFIILAEESGTVEVGNMVTVEPFCAII